jgi:LPXTG-site transpeptidase (sortase) family protein
MFSGTDIRIIPPSYFDTVGEMLAGYQKALTNDRNIPNDSQWEFYTVSFDSNGGSGVTPASTLTVEGGKAAGWPEDPTRMGCTFAGWFDAAKGGTQMTKDSVFTGPVTLYAQWLSNGPKDNGSDFVMLGNELPATGFSSGRFTPLSERPLDLVYKPTGHTLQIPELGISETILTVPLTDGSYPVEWLGSQIGLLEGSSLPGEGVTILTGHNHLNTTETGPFLFIGTLDKDDRIMINKAGNSMLTYRVYGNYKIASDGFAGIADKVSDNALILITCEDESVNGGYLNRRVILADPL